MLVNRSNSSDNSRLAETGNSLGSQRSRSNCAVANTSSLLQASNFELNDAELAALVEKKLQSSESVVKAQALGDVGLLSLTLEYMILHRNDFGYEKFIDAIIDSGLKQNDPNFRVKVGKLLITSLRERLNANEDTTQNNMRVYDLIVENYIRKGYMFHGFNGSFASSIQKHGLNASKFFWKQSDLDFLETILNKAHGHDQHMALGWRNINYGNGNLFLSDHPNVSKGYALRSPEWFNEFCCGGHLGLGFEAQHPRRLAFKNKDYEKCKLNIEFFINSHSDGPNALSGAEKEYIREFFNGYWNEFCGEDSGPKLAIVKRSALKGLSDYAPNYSDFAAELQRSLGRSDLETMYGSLFKGSGLCNFRTNTTIPPESIQLISI